MEGDLLFQLEEACSATAEAVVHGLEPSAVHGLEPFAIHELEPSAAMGPLHIGLLLALSSWFLVGFSSSLK